MLHSVRISLIPAVCMLFLSACVSTPADFEQPSVSVTSFKPQSSGGITPEFEIVLHITNPNRDSLELDGMSYTINLNDNNVMSGVANDLPAIEPYGEAYVTLYATANLLGGLQLLAGLMNTKGWQIDYEFNAKLDAGPYRPIIRIRKKGVLSENMGQQ